LSTAGTVSAAAFSAAGSSVFTFASAADSVSRVSLDLLRAVEDDDVSRTGSSSNTVLEAGTFSASPLSCKVLYQSLPATHQMKKEGGMSGAP
jgi:hypothetical protein